MFDSLFKNKLTDCLLRPNLCHARINIIQDILSHLTQSRFSKIFYSKKKKGFQKYLFYLSSIFSFNFSLFAYVKI